MAVSAAAIGKRRRSEVSERTRQTFGHRKHKTIVSVGDGIS
jgi:hypothetical protein